MSWRSSRMRWSEGQPQRGRDSMRRFTAAILGMALVAAAAAPALAGKASGQGAFVGMEAGMAKGIEVYDDATDTGAAFGPFGGYMFNDYIGLQANIQAVWNNTTHEPESQNTWILGEMIGPRL